MKTILSILLVLFFSNSFSQEYTENDIRELAKTTNKEFKNIGDINGVSPRGCIAIGRTLTYQYNVPENWEAPLSLKDDLIANYKTIGIAKSFFLNNINVDFQYFKKNRITKRISVKSNEFSTFNYKLGDYFSIKDHPKAKGINLKLRVPVGWEIEEAQGPNIVKKFTKDGCSYSIITKDHITFFSRNEVKDMFGTDNSLNEYAEALSSEFINAQVLEKSLITVGSHPTLSCKIKGSKEQLGIMIPVIMMSWNIFYEDKIISLMAMGLDNPNFKALEKTFLLITNSLIFPDQFKK